MIRVWSVILAGSLLFFTVFAGGMGRQGRTSAGPSMAAPVQPAQYYDAYAVYQAREDGAGGLQALLEECRDIARGRLDAMGLRGADITLTEDGRLRVALYSVEDPEGIFSQLFSTPRLEFADAAGQVLMDGTEIQSASVSGTAPVYVQIQFTQAGTEQFAKISEAYLGEAVSILLDGEVISSPIISSVITNGTVVIDGMFSQQDATVFAALLRGGSYPLEWTQVEYHASPSR